MKTFLVILWAVLANTALASEDNEAQMNRISEELRTLVSTDPANGIPVLVQKLRNGTPIEKDAALYAIDRDNLVDQVPFVLDAITDMTPAPRYDDTGWTSIGRHAGWVVRNLILNNDRAWLSLSEQNGKADSMDFLNSPERLQVKRLLETWWNDFHTRKLHP
uniref:HEAT repeat domain-containing protein n=1 Tax=Desulfatirhabdium butyrativorans TaxID=340467 RepID=A0A7C4MPH7_9BACT